MSIDARMLLTRGSLQVDARLEVSDGAVLALLGPNGAGKTTTLRALSGLLPLDGGRITVDGEIVDDPAAGVFVEPHRRSTGYVFQDHALFDHLTVVENVAFGRRARGEKADTARQAAREWIERVGLTAYANARPHALSGGQAQRVALARALATEPRLLLLDEPLAALDAHTRDEMRRELRRHLTSFDGTVVLVTHDPVDAYALADEVAVVHDGQVVQSGTFDAVTAHPRSRFVAELVGVNLVRGTVEHGVLTTTDGARIVIADAAAGAAFAVIRPSSITLSRDDPGRVSAQNTWSATVRDIDRLGERVRVLLDGALPLVAEITTASLASLRLATGDTVVASVKATDIDCYPA